MAMDPKADRMVRRTTMIASVTAAYFLLTADYGPQENAITPIKRGIESFESAVKSFFFGRDKKNEDSHQAPPQPKEAEQSKNAKLK